LPPPLRSLASPSALPLSSSSQLYRTLPSGGGHCQMHCQCACHHAFHGASSSAICPLNRQQHCQLPYSLSRQRHYQQHRLQCRLPHYSQHRLLRRRSHYSQAVFSAMPSIVLLATLLAAPLRITCCCRLLLAAFSALPSAASSAVALSAPWLLHTSGCIVACSFGFAICGAIGCVIMCATHPLLPLPPPSAALSPVSPLHWGLHY
jgi:hypothetical protein